jgi:hypothetical protein
MQTATAWAHAALLALVLWMSTGAVAVQGQHLIDRYQQARQLSLLDQFYPRSRYQAIRPQALHRLDVAVDSLHRTAPRPVTRAQDTFPVQRIRAAHRFEKEWLHDTFGDTEWSFLGPQPERTFFDTTRTVELRARLQAHFDAPTYTLADDLQPDRDDFDQFAYWFIVNDSIPVVVSDANGPRDRGLIVATERRWRSVLPEVRRNVLAPLKETPDRAPYVDYFYDDIDGRWYRVGFDGVHFFIKPIARRQLTPGRRPAPPTP